MHVLGFVVGGWEISAQFVFRGFIEGLTYGMVALGLVLIYKASGVINFAQGQLGAFGALLMTIINFNYGVPIWVGMPLAIACGAALGGVTELLVVRRLFHQPRPERRRLAPPEDPLQRVARADLSPLGLCRFGCRRHLWVLPRRRLDEGVSLPRRRRRTAKAACRP